MADLPKKSGRRPKPEKPKVDNLKTAPTCKHGNAGYCVRCARGE